MTDPQRTITQVMETQDEPPLLHETKALNPWQPERDPVRLAVLGKLAEELGEAGAIVARCIIQGIDESEPVTKVANREALTKELADVWATGTMAIELFGLSSADIARRVERKIQHLRAWHKLIGTCGLDDLAAVLSGSREQEKIMGSGAETNQSEASHEERPAAGNRGESE
jgi:hypothetical protein